MSSQDEIAPLYRLQLAGAQMRLLTPALRLQSEQVPPSILGSREFAEHMRRVLDEFAGTTEALADEVDELAAAARRLEQQQKGSGHGGA